MYNVYGFFAGDGVREEEEEIEVVVVVVVIELVVAIEIIGRTFIESSLLSVFLVEISGIVRLSRSIDLTGICSCSSSSNISSISISSAVLPFVFDVVIDFEESFAIVVDSILAGTDIALIDSSLTCEGDDRTVGTSIYRTM